MNAPLRGLTGLLLALTLLTPAQAENISLGVEDAIARAIATNLRTRLAREQVHEAEANLQGTNAAYSPKIAFSAGQYNRTVNLAAQGFSGAQLPVPTRIGPFFSFDSHFELLYRLYDSGRGWGIRGREIDKQLRELQVQLQDKAVTVLASATYISLLEARERSRVSQADVALAQRLTVQAENLEKAGVAAGVDLTRSQTRLAERRLQLTQDLEQVRETQRQLLRLVGLPLTDELTLVDDLLQLANPFPEPEETVQLARQARLELQLASDQVALTQSQVQLAKAGDDPTLDIVARGGLAGNSPLNHSSLVHNVGLNLSWPLFDGGLTDAQVKAAQSRVEQARLQLDDTQIQVESEVRDAYSGLQTALESMAVAEQNVTLAGEELSMTQDRFQVGLTNNLELLASEDALTRARYSRLRALANYNLGLIRLAAASGRPDLLLQAFRDSKLLKGATDE